MNSLQVKIFGFMIVPVHILIITVALKNVANTGQGALAIGLTCLLLFFSIVFWALAVNEKSIYV